MTRAPSAQAGFTAVERLLATPEADGRPVAIDRLIRAQGIELVRRRFDDGEDVSGFYLKEGNRQLIGVNASHALVRQRFTMAHELGHAILHGHEGLHLDQSFTVRFRDAESATGTDADEIAANRFAAELLMPEPEILDAITAKPFDVSDDDAVRAVARRFGVSAQAMAIRLNVLGAHVDGTPRF